MKKIVALAMILALTAALLCGCMAEKLIVGTWEHEETVLGVVTKTTYVFNEDGTGTASTVLGLELDMTYTINEDKLSITTTVLGVETTTEYTFQISGKTLTLTDGDTTMEFEKID